MHFDPNTVHTCVTTLLGHVWLAASPKGLCGCWFEGQSHLPPALHQVPPTWPENASHPILQKAATLLQRYLAGDAHAAQAKGFALDASVGTAFQQRVWKALLGIPAGTTVTYAALSQSMGQPTAVRAIASAIARNPLSIWVPCHRVLGSNGRLTGYAGGLWRKTALLRLEGVTGTWPDATTQAMATA
jgi:methylated-DNA-[protein]-cysteine S-methyltransferase